MLKCAPYLVAGFLMLAGIDSCLAGMPALLPTDWIAGESPSQSTPGRTASDGAQWQAISFFVACLLLSAWGVKGLWNSLRGSFPALPPLTYGRSLSLVVLWGLCFVVVLTMISGARELMTPGAWRKQGWTYTLADSKSKDPPDRRRDTIEHLRNALWQYAATHEGRFPSESDAAIDPKLWEIPNFGGLRFLYVSGLSAEENGKLLAFEPELDGDERNVLLTNGFLGTMRTSEIEKLLEGPAAP